MTFSHILDIIAAGMLGGGIALVGNLLSIYLSTIRKQANGRSIASQVMTILTGIAEVIRNRHDAQDEAESIAELFTGIQALLHTYSKNKADPDTTPVVKVTTSQTGLTASVTADNITKSHETSDAISTESAK